MQKETFKFINEGNGIEGIMSKGKINVESSSKIKVAIQKKQTDLIWDPIFECFVPKNNENILEKGTVLIK